MPGQNLAKRRVLPTLSLFCTLFAVINSQQMDYYNDPQTDQYSTSMYSSEIPDDNEGPTMDGVFLHKSAAAPKTPEKPKKPSPKTTVRPTKPPTTTTKRTTARPTKQKTSPPTIPKTSTMKNSTAKKPPLSSILQPTMNMTPPAGSGIAVIFNPIQNNIVGDDYSEEVLEKTVDKLQERVNALAKKIDMMENHQVVFSVKLNVHINRTGPIYYSEVLTAKPEKVINLKTGVFMAPVSGYYDFHFMGGCFDQPTYQCTVFLSRENEGIVSGFGPYAKRYAIFTIQATIPVCKGQRVWMELAEGRLASDYRAHSDYYGNVVFSGRRVFAAETTECKN